MQKCSTGKQFRRPWSFGNHAKFSYVGAADSDHKIILFVSQELRGLRSKNLLGAAVVTSQ